MRRNCSHKIQKNTRKKLESLFVAVFEPMVVDGVRSEGYGGGVFGYLDFPSFLGVSGNGKILSILGCNKSWQNDEGKNDEPKELDYIRVNANLTFDL
jgi:hypothetical protein